MGWLQDYLLYNRLFTWYRLQAAGKGVRCDQAPSSLGNSMLHDCAWLSGRPFTAWGRPVLCFPCFVLGWLG